MNQSVTSTVPASPVGLHRVLEPSGAAVTLPQAARRLDARREIWPSEVRIAIDTLNLDAASYRQLAEKHRGVDGEVDGGAVREEVLAIVAERGKMQNPVTGSGGMLIGTVDEVGPDSPLGLTVGDRVATLTDAVEQLAEVPKLTLTAVSELVESDPFGGPDQPAYLNGVVLATYAGSPAALLRALHAIEHRNGRTREVRWGARTLDLDLVQFGIPGSDRERLSDTPALLLPHPRAHERNFVLIPWARLDPEATLRVGPTVAHPIQRVADLAAELGARGVRTGPIRGPAW